MSINASLENDFPKTRESENVSIREVWAKNFEEEIQVISGLLERYPYVAMDTEFPGIIHNISSKIKESTYKNIKANVDDLKLIQFGITLSDEKGNTPDPCTWQFNMNFDVKTDKHSTDSINLLSSSGICFDKLVEHGITPEDFGAVITTSGLVLNDDIKWVVFHGSYDFSYLIKLLTNLPLPDNEIGFFEIIKIYFPTLYDIRHLTKNLDILSKSLQKMAQELDIIRIGNQHQAGSDSQVTSLVFHKLTSLYINSDNLKNDEGVLFGIGNFYEDEASTIFDASHMVTPLSLNNISTLSNIPSLSNNININNINPYTPTKTAVTNNSNNTSTIGPSNNNLNKTTISQATTGVSTSKTPLLHSNFDINNTGYYHPSYGYHSMSNNYYRGNGSHYPYNFQQYGQGFNQYQMNMGNEYMMQGMNNNMYNNNTLTQTGNVGMMGSQNTTLGANSFNYGKSPMQYQSMMGMNQSGVLNNTNNENKSSIDNKNDSSNK